MQDSSAPVYQVPVMPHLSDQYCSVLVLGLLGPREIVLRYVTSIVVPVNKSEHIPPELVQKIVSTTDYQGDYLVEIDIKHIDRLLTQEDEDEYCHDRDVEHFNRILRQ